jgi:hypothetical protein
VPWANHKNAVGEEALKFFVRLYEIEREVQLLDTDERRRIWELGAKPIVELMHKWLIAQRQRVPNRNGSICDRRFSAISCRSPSAALPRSSQGGGRQTESARLE